MGFLASPLKAAAACGSKISDNLHLAKLVEKSPMAYSAVLFLLKRTVPFSGGLQGNQKENRIRDHACS